MPPSCPFNKLKTLTSLKNSYFALRHGQSLANVQKIISSDPSISTVEHGLSALGKEQVSASAQLFAQKYHEKGHHHNMTHQPVAIYSRYVSTHRIICGMNQGRFFLSCLGMT